MNELKPMLVDLKRRGEVKHYRDEPTTRAYYGRFMLTYCLERTPYRDQPTLAISRLDRKAVGLLPDEFSAITEVFGPPTFIAEQMYPKRGETRLFVW